LNQFKADLQNSPMWATKDKISELAVVSCEIGSNPNGHDVIDTFRSQLGIGSILTSKYVTVGAFSKVGGKISPAIRPIRVTTPERTIPADTPDDEVLYISQ